MSGRVPIYRTSRAAKLELLDFGARDVECPVCGAKDNHCDNRRGLCDICYCALANEVGEAAFAAMEYETLLRKARNALVNAIRNGTYTVGRNDRARKAFMKANAKGN